MPLISITDSALESGAVGFFIKSSDPTAKVAFSNLRVSEISAQSSAPVPTSTR